MTRIFDWKNFASVNFIAYSTSCNLVSKLTVLLSTRILAATPPTRGSAKGSSQCLDVTVLYYRNQRREWR